ncbi:Peptidyl-prolyl cis-trans isomerase [Dirofilaria immitis]|nr:Peptidyl-prolyl cis-trans isomerase [Dirofilaria immitis]
MSSIGRIQTFFDLAADDIPIGRLIFELRDDICPKTCENFRALCTGEKGFSYKIALSIVSFLDFVHSGDFETNNANRSGGYSIFGKKYFDDENFIIKHNGRGILSMDNYGWPDTVSSRFFITFDEAPWLDDYHVAFGRLIDGFNTFDRLESYGVLEGYGAQKPIAIKETN